MVLPWLAVPSSLRAEDSSAGRLEEVQVIGQRNLLGQSLVVPGNVASISVDEQLSLNRTVGDWLTAVPGVTLNGQGGLLQSYSVRGFSRWRVRTEVDGVPILTDRRAGNSASFLAPELVGRSTVRRGPGSALFGSGALGGVVGLETVDASDLEMTAGLQSNDQALSLSLLSPLGSTTTAGISLRSAERAEDADGSVLNTGFEQIAAVVKTEQRIGDLKVAASWLPSSGRDIGKSGARYPDERIVSYPHENHSLARVDVGDGEDWLLRAYHHYQDWETDTLTGSQRRNRTRYEAHTVGGLFYAVTRLARGEGRYGVEWVGRRGVSISDVEEESPTAGGERRSLIDGREDTLAAFIDQQWSRDRLIASAGLRYDAQRQSQDEQRRDDGRWSGSAALSFRPTPTLELVAEVGTGFRFPNLTERYFNGVTPRGDTVGNPDLKAETSRSLELGLRYDPGNGSIGLRVYGNDLQDYIERFDISESVRSFRNVDDARIWGYEVELAWGGETPWSHGLSYQWQRGEDDDGSALADLNAPEWRYFLSWQGERVGLHSDLRYRATRETAGPGETALASAWLWSGQLSWRLGTHWEGELFLINGFDELYRATADSEAPFQPGRTVGLRLRWRKA